MSVYQKFINSATSPNQPPGPQCCDHKQIYRLSTATRLPMLAATSGHAIGQPASHCGRQAEPGPCSAQLAGCNYDCAASSSSGPYRNPGPACARPNYYHLEQPTQHTYSNSHHMATPAPLASHTPAALARKRPGALSTPASNCCRSLVGQAQAQTHLHPHPHPHQQQHQHQHQHPHLHPNTHPHPHLLPHPHPQPPMTTRSVDNFFKTDDPVLLRWLQALRFDTELESLSSLQARSLAIDEFAARALSVRNSQVAIQEARLESNFILDYIDYMIEALPLHVAHLSKYTAEFSELWSRLVEQTSANAAPTVSTTVNGQRHTSHECRTTTAASAGSGPNRPANGNNPLTIIQCTPRKAAPAFNGPQRVISQQPLDKLAVQVRALCAEFTNRLCQYQDCSTMHQQPEQSMCIENDVLESSLRKLKELYGKYVEVFIRAQCANIVGALNYDFTQSSLNRLSSTSSLVHAARPFESCSSQLPLKWALIALWQLTKDDSYLCRTLTERWHTLSSTGVSSEPGHSGSRRLAARRCLDFGLQQNQSSAHTSASDWLKRKQCETLLSESQKLYEACAKSNNNNSNNNGTVNSSQNSSSNNNSSGNSSSTDDQDENRQTGALSSALKQQRQHSDGHKQSLVRQTMSTIELLIEIIISQPNKHERLDVMNFIHSEAQQHKLIDVDEWDQSVSAAIYTSNQYKVAALRILNHLCVNNKAIKTILKCFSTPPPKQGQPIVENKIIRSIFECYQSSQEHIYQNETMLRTTTLGLQTRPLGSTEPKRARQTTRRSPTHNQDYCGQQQDDYSDYGSRRTNSNQTYGSLGQPNQNLGHKYDNNNNNNNNNEHEPLESTSEGDDVVVKEAIRLLVQLTTPFHSSNKGLDFYTLIGRFSIDSLVKYMTNIMRTTKSREMLLLSLSALANISFITTEPMKQHATTRIMLEVFRASKDRSKDLELRDQAVTILANTANKNVLDIVSNGGLNFLLSCLESCPARMASYKPASSDTNRTRDPFACTEEAANRLQIENKPRDRKPIDFCEDFPETFDCHCDPLNQQQVSQRIDMAQAALGNACLARLSQPELAAMERIHQKTAIAFARISSDPNTTKMVLKYGGVKQMIDLCKFANKRNHSDTVLIACVAALRKIDKIIGRDIFKHYNALDLIELHPDQTLEIYGSDRDHQRLTPHIPGHQSRLYASDV